MNRRWRTLALGAALAAGLGSCSDDKTAAPAGSTPVAPLAAAPVESRELELSYSADAVVEAVRQSTVAAQVSGRVVEVRFDVGAFVKKGEVIVRIDESAVAQVVAASEAQVREAQASLANARTELDRARQLAGQKFLSQAALDRAESTYKVAQERVSGLLAGAGQARTERSFATIVAPYSGVVSARHVEVGEMATPGKPLMTGFDPGTLRVSANLPQAQVAAVQQNRKAKIEVPSLGSWIDSAGVTLIPSADPRTHTTEVRIALPGNVSGIYPGVYARAHFVVGRAQRLLVPRAAVVRRSELTAVYVVPEGGRVQLRQVRLGSDGDEGFIEVLSGLRAGELVALDPLKAAGQAGT